MERISKAALHLNADQAMAEQGPSIYCPICLFNFIRLLENRAKKAGVEAKEGYFFHTEGKDRQHPEFS